MTKTTNAICLMALFCAGCATDDSAAGGGNATDMLPKRGELATDPTIVSTVASCVPPRWENPMRLAVHTSATDPAGKANLGACAVTYETASDQSAFGESPTCSVLFPQPACALGNIYTVGITVSNDTGGVTTASVRVTVSPSPE